MVLVSVRNQDGELGKEDTNGDHDDDAQPIKIRLQSVGRLLSLEFRKKEGKTVYRAAPI